MNRLKKLFWPFTEDQRGIALILVAAGMVAFTGFMALVADVGLLTLNKQRLVNAVDAAALAGVHELPVNPDYAKGIAVNYALQNNVVPLEPQVGEYLGTPNTKLTVSATRQVDFVFARVLGINSGNVSAAATAAVYGISAMKGAAPLAIPDRPFEYGVTYNLKIGANSPDPSVLGPGTFGALSLGEEGADFFEYNLKYGYPGQIEVGDAIDTETGNMSNPTLRAVDYRLAQCKDSCTPTHFDPGCPRLIFIPVYTEDSTLSGQVASVTITGFAAFLLDGVLGQGTDSYITGSFVRTVAEGEINPSQVDYGLLGAKLIE